MAAKPIWNYIPPALIALNTLLVAENWYLRAQSPGGLFVVLLLLIGMTLALVLVSRKPKEEAARPDAGGSVRSGIVTAGLILVISLGAKLAAALGAVHYGDIALRATMAIVGVFLAVTGNAIPKTLTPLATLHCDPAKVQEVQRLAGWIWALAGLAVGLHGSRCRSTWRRRCPSSCCRAPSSSRSGERSGCDGRSRAHSEVPRRLRSKHVRPLDGPQRHFARQAAAIDAEAARERPRCELAAELAHGAFAGCAVSRPDGLRRERSPSRQSFHAGVLLLEFHV